MKWGKPKPAPLFPEITLKSGRVLMRPPAKTDWPQWYDVRSKNKTRLKSFEPRWADNALDEGFFDRRLMRQSREWHGDRAYAFLLFKREDNALIGGMNINNICRGAAQFASLGYWVDNAHEGQGFMAETLMLTIKFCFEDLDLHRINASTLIGNERSKKTLINAGFKEEGLAEKYLQIDGQWQDHVLYGLPIERWKKLQNA